MRKRPVLSLLLTLALAAGLLSAPAAAASTAPRLVVSSTEATSQSVGLTGVPTDCESLQVTLSLSKNGVDYDFAADSSLNRPGLYTTYTEADGTITLYLTTKSGVLTESGSLTLGAVSTVDTPFTITGATGLKLLDGTDGETTYDSVSQNGSSSGGGSTGVTTWPVSITQAVGGTVTANVARAAKGNTVTLTAAADSGYELEQISVSDAAGKAITLAAKGDGTYTFTMPASKVTVTAAFARQGEAASRPFIDVAPGAWYDEAVQYVYENGLMSGTGDGRFSPDVTTSRAMIVTILYRLEGSPAVTGGSAFTDVAAGTWYTDAVAWASANGIVSGYGEGKFGPNDPITREQMAAILCRYAGYKGMDVAKRAELSAFTDAGQVSDYAVETMRWAVAEGLITGTSETTLSPAGSATRAQAALILMRFCALEG